jgi:hypothetical protein
MLVFFINLVYFSASVVVGKKPVKKTAETVGSCLLFLVASRLTYFSTLKMEMIFIISVSLQTTRSYNREYIVHSYGCENLESEIFESFT